MKKYIFIGAFGLIFLVVILLSFNKSAIEYTDFETARKLSKKVQVVGTWAKEYPTYYNTATNMFEFFMRDKKGKLMYVRFNGPQPNNFTIAPEFVVKGYVQDTTFIASQIITKCPSKYEADPETIKK
jgi:cytochrome c-type biogenesis protein CcmE